MYISTKIQNNKVHINSYIMNQVMEDIVIHFELILNHTIGVICMPSPKIHYCIANKILQTVKLDRTSFIIGNLAPDAHTKARGGRLKSHFQKKNTDLSDISEFKEKYMLRKYDDFALGYYCHLVADTISFNNFNFHYLKDSSEEEKIVRVKMCYKDYYILNIKLLNFYKFTKENIVIPKQLYIDEIERETLVGLINDFQQNFKHNNNEDALTILNMEYVLNEINAVAKKCVIDIKGYV